MTRPAVGDGVRAGQCKTSLRVLLKDFAMVPPVLRSVAGLAFRTELPAMNVGVAIGAGRGSLDKLEILMAGRAPCFGVDPDEWKASLAMRESRWLAHVPPRLHRVTLLAVPANLSMWILIPRLRHRVNAHEGKQK
jgi:hypothetical protein